MKKNLSQKFQKKYFFFQKSFFDFLYWRSIHKKNAFFSTRGTFESLSFSSQMQNELEMHLNFVRPSQMGCGNKFYPFEQEKLSFYQYWKTNSLFHSPNQKHKKIQNILKSSKKFPSFQSQSFLNNKKNSKFFSNSKKSFPFFRNQKLYLLFLKKRKAKLNHFSNKNSTNENSLSLMNSFQIFENFEFIPGFSKSQKIGNFFPKKKFFIQYWVFPFLGILFFFSSQMGQNTSFFFVQKEKIFHNKIFFEPFQIQNRKIVEKFMPWNLENKNEFLPSRGTKKNQNKQQSSLTSEKYFFALRTHIPIPSTFLEGEGGKNFSNNEFFSNLEKTEYEEFLKFSSQIFQTIEKNNFTKIFFFPTYFEKKFISFNDLKRNSLNWKWFSLNSNNFIPQSMISIFSQIPQKAEFLNSSQFLTEESMVKNSFLFQAQVNLKSSTPLIDYSKNLFSIDEFKRSLSLLNLSRLFDKFSLNSYKIKENCQFNSEIQKFFQNQVFFDFNKKEKIFLHTPSGIGVASPPPIPFGDDDGESGKNSLYNTYRTKNLFFIEKWSKIQKFSNFLYSKQNKLKKMSFSGIQKVPFCEIKFTQSTLDFQKVKNTEISSKLMNLDSLYFQKLFQKLNIESFENRLKSQVFQNLQKQFLSHKKLVFFPRLPFPQRVWGQGCEEKFFKFKKQTFDFFTFQYYNKKYKHFFNFLSFKASKFKKLQKQKKQSNTIFFQNQKIKNFFHPLNQQAIEKKKSQQLLLSKKFVYSSLYPQKSVYRHPFPQRGGEKNENMILFKLKSPILFQFLPSQKFYCFPKRGCREKFLSTQKFDPSDKILTFDFQVKKNIYPHNFYNQNLNFSFFPHFEQKTTTTKNFLLFSQNNKGLKLLFDTSPSSMGKSNQLNFFQKCIKNFFTSLKIDNFKNFFSNMSKFQGFEKNFLFETSQFEKPLIFRHVSSSHNQIGLLQDEKKTHFSFKSHKKIQTLHTHIPSSSPSPFWEGKEEGGNQFFPLNKDYYQNKKFLLSNSFYVLKFKKRIPFVQYKTHKKNIQVQFLGFSKKQRKFEKTFQAFFSPLKDTQNFSSRGSHPRGFFSFEQKQKNLACPPYPQSEMNNMGEAKKKSIFSKLQPNSSQKSMNSEKIKKDLFFLKSISVFLTKNPSNLSSHFFISTNNKTFKTNRHRNQFSFLNLEIKNLNSVFFQESKEEQKIFSKNRLSPQLVLKRDGFLFLPSHIFQNLKLEGKQSNDMKKLRNQRLEKEKNFQKKRRLKKEKLETRRRKKRKRFFPRPVWLRMSLYKKFLATRHSQKLFSFSLSPEKEKRKFFPFSLAIRSRPHFFENGNTFEENRKMNFLFLSKNFSGISTRFLKKNKKWFQKREQKQVQKYFLKKFFGYRLPHPLLGRGQGCRPEFSRNKPNFLKTTSDFQNYNIDSLFLKKQNFTFQSKTYQQNDQQNELQSQNFLFFNRKKTGWLGYSGESKASKNIEHYKISNEIYQEFLRLSWKSSWFQNNFKPYTQTIQENFQKIQSIESQKNFSHFFNILKSKNFLLFFYDFPLFFQQSKNDFLIQKSVLQKFSWYSNVQNSFTLRNGGFLRKKKYAGVFQNTNFSSFFTTKNSLGTPIFFREGKVGKISEYNRILYTRISDVLKKFKFSENMTTDSFFQSLKKNTRKNEKIFSISNNSFFTKTALFFEKFQIPSQPQIPAFSVFSSLFNDFSIKPTGDIPTLRAMWAFQKTNFSHFQERNAIQNLWAFKKRKDAFNSFQGTKKIMNFLRKSNTFEKFKTPNQFSLDWSIFVSSYFPKKKGDTFVEYRQTRKKDFFLANKKGEFFPQEKSFFLNPLDTITLKKFQNFEKKSSAFGIQSLKQNSKISYRYFKFYLSPFYQKRIFSLKNGFIFEKLDDSNLLKFLFKEDKSSSVLNRFEEKSKMTKAFPMLMKDRNKNRNLQNSAKSSLNFWWAQKPFQDFHFLGTSQFEIFSEFSTLKLFSFAFEQKNEKYTFFLQNQVVFSNIPFLLLSAFLFHFAVFYTLFKIPEIRTVFKFTFLIFSKFWNAFFLVFFSIYNIFKRYTNNGFTLLTSSSAFVKNQKTQKQTKQSGHYYYQNFLYLKTQQKNTKLNDFVFQFFPLYSGFFNKHKFIRTPSGIGVASRTPSPFGKGTVGKKEKLYFQSSKEDHKSIFFGKSQRYFLTTSKKFNKKISSFHLSLQKSKETFFYFSFHYKFDKSKTTFFYSFLQPKIQKSLIAFSSKKFISGFPLFFYQQTQSGKKQYGNFSKIEKNLSQIALSFLVFGKHILFIPYTIFKFGSSIYTKIFEIIEGIFYAFYKFLEKPAEFMIEFIAFVFLIEWSSDILGFFPDSIESSLWKSSQKLLRPVRTGIFFLSFGMFFFETSTKQLQKTSLITIQQSQNFSVFNPFQFLFSIGFFQFSNFTAYVLQKRLFYFFENVPSILIQPDIDILVRQRKGILFWDIWSEILLKAAEKYNVNLPSFVTLKEEQELFIEKLVRDSEFFESFHFQHTGLRPLHRLLHSRGKKNFENQVLKTNQQNSSAWREKNFSSFLQNFVIQNRPLSFFDFYFLSKNKNSFSSFSKAEKLQQFLISNLFFRISSNTKFFQNSSNFMLQNKLSNFFVNKNVQNETFFTFFPLFGLQGQNFQSFQTYSKSGKKISIYESFHSFQNMKKGDRWQCNQYATFQSQETDFFLDIYPPKSLKHVHFLKYYEPAQYTLGSFICQIYAGIFPKQISKNILVIGESGTAKTFFLRALAGETEMKIITENASRYAIVQRGVAVGMKYLRDVFDAIALQTPCFFVMEDLHIIGSKRPFMISENENTQNIQSSFGLEQQEVHETNQMIYQSSRHSISDFRRPYKGDFSLGIPTNYFLQTFYTPFFSTSAQQQRGSLSYFQGNEKNSSFYPIDSFHEKGHFFQNSQFFGGNFSSSIWSFLSSPLPIDALEALLQNTGIHPHPFGGGGEKENFQSFSNKKNIPQIQSVLQFSKEQIFAPPATSPFTILMMKEQNKLKPKKIVQENSWGGLSADQILLYQKESSSIRAKIAVLAEKTMNLSRGKFDMITDFLVIIDSVRSNRGFVVFGTTHKPSALDSALRRPGRFDETLSLSRIPHFLNRFEIFKMNFENSVSTFDFFDSSCFTENFSEMDLFDILSQTKLSFFHNYNYEFKKFLPTQKFFSQSQNFKNSGIQNRKDEKLFYHHPQNGGGKKQIYSQISPIKAFHSLLKSSVFEDFYTQKQFNVFYRLAGEKIKINHQQKKISHFSKSSSFTQNFSLRDSNIFFDQSYTILPKGPSHMVSLAYSKLGIFLAETNLFHLSTRYLYPLPTAFVPLILDIEKNSSKRSNFQKYYGNVFFDSCHGPKNQKNLQLLIFLSEKIAEFFISLPIGNSQQFIMNRNIFEKGNYISIYNPKQQKNISVYDKTNSIQNLRKQYSFLFQKPFSFFSRKFYFSSLNVEKENEIFSFLEQKEKISTYKIHFFKKFFFTKMNCGQSQQKSLSFAKRNFSWTVYGNDEMWHSATPFLHSLIQKRFLFTKNLLLSKMLIFENMDQRRKPPNPPGSSILMPSKKYENYKRTEVDYFQKAHFSIHEKLQMHQKQRFLKQLYNIPVQTYFCSQLRKNHKTFFSSSFQEFAYLDSFVQRSSSSHFYYRKYIQIRHRFSNINQWWNGMFPEHTRETSYLSDVDWRTMFVSSSTFPLVKNKSGQKQIKTSEFIMDFPDVEQYYDPRNRRWFFKSNIDSHFVNKSFVNSNFWSIFEKDLQYEIFSHFLMESFYQSFFYFEKKREMLDFFAFHLLSKKVLKEFDFITTFSRF